MKDFESIERYLNEKLEENQRAIQECDEGIDRLSSAIEQADADLMAAEKAFEADAYAKAKDEKRTAEDTLEMYLKKKATLESAPLITQAEYKRLLSTIRAAAKEIHEEQNDRAAGLLIKMRKIADEAVEVTAQADALLHTLQYGIYKDADKTVLANGNTVTFAEQYRSNDTVSIFYAHRVAGADLEKRAKRLKESGGK